MRTLKVNQIRNNIGGTAIDVPGAAKAFVKWDGVTGTVKQSLGVTSVTRLGTGSYTVNFSTAFPTADYVVALAASRAVGSLSSAAAFLWINAAPTTTTATFGCFNTAGLEDGAHLSATFFHP